MRAVALALLLAACAKPAVPEVPYVETWDERRIRPLELVEAGSGVVAFDREPERVSIGTISTATVVKFDSPKRYHVVGVAPGETTLVAHFGPDERIAIPVIVEPEGPDALTDVAIAVGQQAGIPVDGSVSRVQVGDPGIVSYKVTGAGSAEFGGVQILGERPGRTHVVIAVGEDQPPVFRRVVVTE